MPPAQTIDGLRLLDGTVEPIVRAPQVAGHRHCLRARLSLNRCGTCMGETRSIVTIELASPEAFRLLTGHDPGPALDLSDAYDGRLLP